MTSKYLLLFALLGTSSALLAQPNLPTEGSYRLDDVRQLWHNTLNAAGLTADSMSNRGQSFFDLSHCSGNFHRVQEGSQGNRLAFFTERYQHIGSRLYAYGSFHFNTARIKDRAWSDVLRSYDSNPFFSGSSIKGRYDQQDIRLKAAVATLPIGPLRYGFTLDYELGDLSRLRDPRSRSQLLQYQLTPAILYSLGKNRLGLAAFYKRRKEKIANIKTVQTDATMKYYLMSGLENVSGTTGGFSSFNREWVSHEFGTELSYALQAENLHSLTAVSIARSTENVYGTYRYEPGKYVAYRYALHSQNRLQTAHTLHQLDARAQYTQGYADEYRQMLVQETDPLRGFTSYRYDRILTFKKRYQVMLLDLDLHYRANFAPTGRTLQGYAVSTARITNICSTSRNSSTPPSASKPKADGRFCAIVGFGSTPSPGSNSPPKSLSCWPTPLANTPETFSCPISISIVPISSAAVFRPPITSHSSSKKCVPPSFSAPTPPISPPTTISTTAFSDSP